MRESVAKVSIPASFGGYHYGVIRSERNRSTTRVTAMKVEEAYLPHQGEIHQGRKGIRIEMPIVGRHLSLVSFESCDWLGDGLAELGKERVLPSVFGPTIVASYRPRLPFWEKTLKTFRIGDALFRVAGPCVRGPVFTDFLDKTHPLPARVLEFLTVHHADERKEPIFGILLTVIKEGTFFEGEKICPVSYGDPS